MKVIDAFMPSIVSVPLSRHACHCMVKKGDSVSEGQVIATIGGKSTLRCAVHSPVPGKVIDIAKMPLSDGSRFFCVKIETSGSFNYLGKHKAPQGEHSIIETLSGMGVLNTFDTSAEAHWCMAGSASHSLGRPLAEQCAATHAGGSIVVCLGDEDPTVKTTSLLAHIMAQEVKQGAAIIAQAVQAKRIVFIGEADIKDVYSNIDNTDAAVQFVASEFVRYPSAFQNDLKHKIEGITGEELFVDAQTMLTAVDAVVSGTPSMTSYVYVNGEAVRAKGLLRVRVGTPIRFLAEQCGGMDSNAAIIINGLMVGSSATSVNAPIDKCVKCVTFVPSKQLRSQGESECTRCGNCRWVCPERLSPDLLFQFVTGTSYGMEAERNMCTGCGLCNSVCPARLPLVQNIIGGVL